MKTWLPSTEDEIVHAVLTSRTLWHATDPIWDIQPVQVGDRLEYAAWTGASYHSPEDMVATFRSGTRLSELQSILSEHGQCLPIGGFPIGDPDPTLATAIGFALPHAGEARSGAWREWILAMTVVLGDGVLAKSGAKVVKSVAGYDAHKLFIGARGAFGAIVDVTLRTYPSGRLPTSSQLDKRSEGGRPWIQRVSPTDFERAQGAMGVLAADPESSTIWAHTDEPLPRFAHDWVVRGAPGQDGLEWSSDEVALIQKAKRLLDPDNRLNPGALGIC